MDSNELFGDAFDRLKKINQITGSSILLIGPSGSGKTSLVREFAVEVDKPLECIEGSLDIQSNASAIGFYDNTEYWIGSQDYQRDEVQIARLLNLFKVLLKSSFDLLIVSCTSKDNIPKLLQTKFSDIIYLDFPKIQQRRLILEHYLSFYTCNIENYTKDIHKISENTFGFLPCDLQSLANHIIEDIEQNGKIGDKFINKPRDIIRCSALPSFSIDKIPNIKWDDIGGLDSVKKELKELTMWTYSHKLAFKRLGIDPIKGILLYGPPGTGKTLLAKAIATEVNANFINTHISKILNAYIGESERIISDIFTRAKSIAPSVVFFDEIDALFSQRDSNSSHHCQMLISQLLLELDKITSEQPVIVVATTNCPEMIDESFIQSGRFDKLLYIGTPDYWGRKNILSIIFNELSVSENIDIDEIITKTDGFTGADIRSLCNIAGQIAITKYQENTIQINQDDFQKALIQMKCSVSEESIQKYQSWKYYKNTF